MIKFSINKTAFLNTMRIAKQAIGSKIAIPVLSKFKITANSEGILMTASNGQISIEKLLPIDDKTAEMTIESEGSILLEATFFDSIVAQLPENTFEFEEIENEQVLLRSGKSEITLKGQNAELYPMIQKISSQPFVKVGISELKDLFNETAFAASTQESRPVLTGLHLSLENHKTLVAVATDSHRLSQRFINLETVGEDFEIVLPRSAVNAFKNIFTGSDEKEEIDSQKAVNLYLSGTQILFKDATTNLYSRLIEGNYPDTYRLIPEDNLYTLDITFDLVDLAHAMNRAKLMTSGIQNGTVKLSVSADSAIVSVNTPEIGSFFEELTPVSQSGEDIEISFNPQFLTDALKVIKEPNVRIRFISAVRPFTLIPQEQGTEFIQLVTPVRTN